MFYYYAIKGSVVYSHHHDIAKAGLFRFYKNDIYKTDTYELEPIKCEILSTDLISKQGLVEKLNAQGYLTSVEEHYADFYYVMKVRVINDSEFVVSMNKENVNGQNGNDSFSPHSPKIICV